MVLCLDEIQVRFGWNKCRWGDCVVWVGWVVCGWNRIGLGPCGRLGRGEAGESWSWGWNKS